MSDLSNRRYPISYHVKHHEEGTTRDELPSTYGVAEQIFIMAINQNPVEGKDFSFLSLDGNAGAQMGPNELFEGWAIFSGMLYESIPESSVYKPFLYEVVKNIKLLEEAIKTQVDPMHQDNRLLFLDGESKD